MNPCWGQTARKGFQDGEKGEVWDSLTAAAVGLVEEEPQLGGTAYRVPRLPRPILAADSRRTWAAVRSRDVGPVQAMVGERLPADRLQDIRSRAVILGPIADALAWRGELDEALRIYREEVLPVYERLGDVRSRAGGWPWSPLRFQR